MRSKARICICNEVDFTDLTLADAIMLCTLPYYLLSYANLLLFWVLFSLWWGDIPVLTRSGKKDQALARRGGYISRIVAVLLVRFVM